MTSRGELIELASIRLSSAEGMAAEYRDMASAVPAQISDAMRNAGVLESEAEQARKDLIRTMMTAANLYADVASVQRALIQRLQTVGETTRAAQRRRGSGSGFKVN